MEGEPCCLVVGEGCYGERERGAAFRTKKVKCTCRTFNLDMRGSAMLVCVRGLNAWVERSS